MRPLVRAIPALALLMMAGSMPAAHGAEFTARDLAAQEGKFAAHSVANDMRAAFLEFFADDALMLRPDVVEAKAWLAPRPAPAILLDWKSQLTILSASKDLGFSTGPSIIRSKKDPASPPGYGQFFSVWKRQLNGEWKVLLDHGISHDGQALHDTPLDARDLPAVGGKPVFDAIDPEQRFISRSAQLGAAAAYGEAIAPRSRFLRNERTPIDGEAALRDYLKSVSGTWSWNTLRQGTSLAGDFAYVLGRYTQLTPGTDAQSGYYIRVWVKEAGRWTLAGEVLTPLPPAPKT
jgi:ketosteroid isomerase-like protein